MASPPPPPSQTHSLPLGIRVSCAAGSGYVRFDGQTSFAPGRWVGIELDLPNGKNNGTVMDVHYFTAKPYYGLFIRPSLIVPLDDNGPNTSTKINGSPSAKRMSSTGSSPGPGLNIDAQSTSPKLVRRASSSISTKPPRPIATKRTITSPSVHPSILTNTMATLSANPMSPSSSRHLTQPSTTTSPMTNPTKPPSHPTTPAFNASIPALVSQTDATISQQKHEDLKTKLKYLQDRRKTDQIAIRTLETKLNDTKEAMDQHTHVLNQLKTLQSDFQAATQSIAEYKKKQQESEAQLAELNDMVESVTMDKEFADSQAEETNIQLNLANSKIEELQLNLQILEEERALISSGEQTAASIDVQTQSNRLRDALFQLKQDRDAIETKLTLEINQMRHALNAKSDIEAQLQKCQLQLQSSESVIEVLRAEIDDLSQSEEMVNQLTDQILNLETKLERQQQHIDDLEVLRELNEQLEATHTENERELVTSVSDRDRKIRDLQDILVRSEEKLADREHVLAQFREKCNALVHENQNLTARLQPDASPPSYTNDHELGKFPMDKQQFLSLHSKLQSHARKAHAKSLDLDLRHLDVQQALDQLDLVQSYLPPWFFKSELEAIQAVLLARRVVFKTDLLLSKDYLQVNNDNDHENSLVHPTDQIGILELRHELGYMYRTSSALSAYMESCPSTVFVNEVIKTGADLIVVEKHLDQIIIFAKQQRNRPTGFCAELKRLNRMLDVSLTQLITPLDAGASLNVYRLSQLIQVHGAHDAGELATMVLHALIKYTKDPILTSGFQSLILQLANIRSSLLRQLEPRLNQASRQFFKMDADKIGSLYTNMKQIADFLHKVLHHYQPPHNSNEHESNSTADQDLEMSDILARHAVDYFDHTKTNPIQSITGLVQSISTEFTRILESVDTSTNTRSAQESRTPNAPWIVRGEQMQAQYTTSEVKPKQSNGPELQGQLDLVTQELRFKENQVQELMLRCQLIESRRSTTNENHSFAKLDSSLVQDLTLQVQKYEDEVSNMNKLVAQLRSETSRLERENQQLSVELTGQKTSRPSSTIDEISPTSGCVSEINTQDDHHQALVSAIHHLRAQIGRLKAAKLVHQLNQSDAFYYYKSSTNTAKGPSSNMDDQSDHVSEEHGLIPNRHAVHAQTRSLFRQAADLASMPKLVTLARQKGTIWQPLAKRPRIQLLKDRIEAKMLVQKAQALHASVQFDALPPVGRKRVRCKPFATVTIPLVAGMSKPGQEPVNCFVDSVAQLEHIHGVFVK